METSAYRRPMIDLIRNIELSAWIFVDIHDTSNTPLDVVILGENISRSKTDITFL